MADPIDATAGVPLLQTPPAVASVNVAQVKLQIADGPVMAAGSALMVSGVVIIQPVANV